MTASMGIDFLARLWVMAGLHPWFSRGAPSDTLQFPSMPDFPAHRPWVQLWATHWGLCQRPNRRERHFLFVPFPQNMALYADVSGKQFPVTRGQDVGRYQVRDAVVVVLRGGHLLTGVT